MNARSAVPGSSGRFPRPIAAVCVVAALAAMVAGCAGREAPEGSPDPAVLNAEGERRMAGGGPEAAEPFFRRAVDAARALADRAAEAVSRLNLARALGRAGKLEDALAELDRAEDLFAALASADGLARTRAVRAGALLLKGDRDAARSELLRALAMAPGDTTTDILRRVSTFMDELSLVAVKDEDAAESRRAILDQLAPGGAAPGGRAPGGPAHAEALMTLGAEAAREGRDGEASRYYAAAAHAYREAGMDASALAAEGRARVHGRPAGLTDPLAPVREERE